MLRATFAALLVLISAHESVAQSKNVKEAIDVIVLFCVAGGDSFEISGTGKAEGGLALKKFGASGEADISISRSEAKGLVEGLRKEISKVTAEQASEARKCMQPYINRILRAILPETGDLDAGNATKNDLQFGEIYIFYPPPRMQCQVNFHIDIGGQRIVPMGVNYRVPHIRLGESAWTIRGEVRCPNGAYCQSPGNVQSGNLYLRNGATYTFLWEMNPYYGQECSFSLAG